MKRLSILFAVVAVLFASCDERDINIAGFSIDKDSLWIEFPEGATRYLQVNSTVEWTVSANQPWVSVSPANGIGSTKCTVLVDSTLSDGVREAKLAFESVEGRTIVMVEQIGFGKFISLKDTVKTIASSTNSIADRYFEVEVTANVDFKISVVDSVNTPIEWITPKQTEVKPDLDRLFRPRTTTVRFDWTINSNTADRVAYINFQPLDEALNATAKSAKLAITQEAAPVITDDRAGDSLAIVTIINRLQLLSPWDVSENMQYWNNVTLWESTDEGLPCPEAVGRVRKANFMMCYTKESLPQELRYLKYIETLNIYSNVNTMLLSIELGDEICDLEYLKHLQIGAFGLVSLPVGFSKLGDKLETLDLNSNNFPEVPAVLCKDSFPKLKKLDLLACRRWTVSDLRKKDSYENGIGLHFKSSVKEDNDLRRLLLWENLEELRLSNNYIEGQIPDFEVGEDGVVAYDSTDVEAWGGDTIKNLVGMPKIMPNMKRLTLNLNFFTGKLPDWVLYHPRLLDWFPESLIYMQQVNAYDSDGKPSKFDNEPTDYEYYFDFFPGYREKYEIKEEFED